MAVTLREKDPKKYNFDGRRVEVGDLDKILKTLTDKYLDLANSRFNTAAGYLTLTMTDGSAQNFPISVLAGAVDQLTRLTADDTADTITARVSNIVKMTLAAASNTLTQSLAANISTIVQTSTSNTITVGNATQNTRLSQIPNNLEIRHINVLSDNIESLSFNPDEAILALYSALAIKETVKLDKITGVTIESPDRGVVLKAGDTTITITDTEIAIVGTAPIKLGGVTGGTNQFLMGRGPGVLNAWMTPFSFGTSALTAGTVTVADANVLATSKVFIQSTDSNGATVRGVLDVHGIGVGTFSVTSKNVATGAILNTDRAKFSYMVVNIV